MSSQPEQPQSAPDAAQGAPAASEHSGVAVRVAVKADLETAVGLFREYLDFYEVTPQDPERPQAFLAERLDTGDSLILLASVPGAGTVGFAQVYPVLSSLDLGPAWLLSDLYVAPAGRRAGVGRTLLREVLRRAREAGVSGVHLDTAYDNHAAQQLYETEGFVRDPFHIYLHDLR